MVEIKAGPELDRAVAEAVGWQYTERQNFRNRFDEVVGRTLLGWWDGDKYIGHGAPLCSTDLNVAFAAAEAVGLFHQHLIVLDGDGWQIWRHEHFSANCYGGDGEVFVGPFSIPALAICAAVLELKETSNDGRAKRMDGRGGSTRSRRAGSDRGTTGP